MDKKEKKTPKPVKRSFEEVSKEITKKMVQGLNKASMKNENNQPKT